jgi:hypothetical protein
MQRALAHRKACDARRAVESRLIRAAFSIRVFASHKQRCARTAQTFSS